jgi:SnoaL-like domain
MSMGAAAMEAIAEQFIDAFNRRDADGLVALCDRQIEFHPTVLVGARRIYRGHDGIRRWVADLARAQIQHQVRVRRVRVLDERSFMLLSEVLLDGEVITPSAMLARVTEAGLIEQAHAYLSDERTLGEIGLMSAE